MTRREGVSKGIKYDVLPGTQVGDSGVVHLLYLKMVGPGKPARRPSRLLQFTSSLRCRVTINASLLTASPQNKPGAALALCLSFFVPDIASMCTTENQNEH